MDAHPNNDEASVRIRVQAITFFVAFEHNQSPARLMIFLLHGPGQAGSNGEKGFFGFSKLFRFSVVNSTSSPSPHTSTLSVQ
jgi:hypothetical protein